MPACLPKKVLPPSPSVLEWGCCVWPWWLRVVVRFELGRRCRWLCQPPQPHPATRPFVGSNLEAPQWSAQLAPGKKTGEESRSLGKDQSGAPIDLVENAPKNFHFSKSGSLIVSFRWQNPKPCTKWQAFVLDCLKNSRFQQNMKKEQQKLTQIKREIRGN